MNQKMYNRGVIASAIVASVLIVAVLGIVGWRMLTQQDTAQQTIMPSETSAEVIMTQDDLDAAVESLDELDFSDEDAKTAELQAEL